MKLVLPGINEKNEGETCKRDLQLSVGKIPGTVDQNRIIIPFIIEFESSVLPSPGALCISSLISLPGMDSYAQISI